MSDTTRPTTDWRAERTASLDELADEFIASRKVRHRMRSLWAEWIAETSYPAPADIDRATKRDALAFADWVDIWCRADDAMMRAASVEPFVAALMYRTHGGTRDNLHRVYAALIAARINGTDETLSDDETVAIMTRMSVDPDTLSPDVRRECDALVRFEAQRLGYETWAMEHGAPADVLECGAGELLAFHAPPVAARAAHEGAL